MKLLLMILLSLFFPASAMAENYIVETEGSSARLARSFSASQSYDNVFQGFAASMSPQAAAELAKKPGVVRVLPDRRRWHTTEWQDLQPGEFQVPAGVRRIGAGTPLRTSFAGAAVAVIDTGIDIDHPDLNVLGGKSCVSGAKTPDDRNGHGTHVAGTIAARNNGAGVVGVAPGTPLYAVQVLDKWGFGFDSDILCGLEWVAENAEELGIRVANMSIGSYGDKREKFYKVSCQASRYLERRALCKMSDAGVITVVAAGNDGSPFDTWPYALPAAYPEVITVTALANRTGRPGDGKRWRCSGKTYREDRPASFSNYAKKDRSHTVQAPGVCVLSTLPNGKYGEYSGTSMASPHVAGIVSLCAVGPCQDWSATESKRWILERSPANSRWGGMIIDPLWAGIDFNALPYSETAPAQTLTPQSKIIRIKRSGSSGKGKRLTIVLAQGNYAEFPEQPIKYWQYKLRGRWRGATAQTVGNYSAIVVPTQKMFRLRAVALNGAKQKVPIIVPGKKK